MDFKEQVSRCVIKSLTEMQNDGTLDEIVEKHIKDNINSTIADLAAKVLHEKVKLSVENHIDSILNDTEFDYKKNRMIKKTINQMLVELAPEMLASILENGSESMLSRFRNGIY